MNKVRSDGEVKAGMPVVLSGSIRTVVLGLAACGAIASVLLEPDTRVYIVPIGGIVLVVALSMERHLRNKIKRSLVHPDDESPGGARRLAKHVVRTYHGFDVSMPVIQGGTILAITLGIAVIVAASVFIAIVVPEPKLWLILSILMACYAAFVAILESQLRFGIAKEAYYVSLSDEEKAKFRQTEVMYRALDL